MFCKKCGKQIPDDSAFCAKCGAPQGAGGEGPGSEAQWEICEIRADVLRGRMLSRDWRFYAEVVGRNGRTMILESEKFNVPGAETLPHGDKNQGRIIDGMVKRLTADGWEPLPNGQYWFSFRFRRRAI